MLPLLLLVLGAPPGGGQARPARMVSTRTESVSAVDASATQRFGWLDVVARQAAAGLDAMAQAQQLASGRALQLFPAFRADLDAVRAWDGREVARAARWIDALPVKVDAQDGGFLLAFRLRGP